MQNAANCLHRRFAWKAHIARTQHTLITCHMSGSLTQGPAHSLHTRGSADGTAAKCFTSVCWPEKMCPKHSPGLELKSCLLLFPFLRLPFSCHGQGRSSGQLLTRPSVQSGLTYKWCEIRSYRNFIACTRKGTGERRMSKNGKEFLLLWWWLGGRNFCKPFLSMFYGILHSLWANRAAIDHIMFRHIAHTNSHSKKSLLSSLQRDETYVQKTLGKSVLPTSLLVLSRWKTARTATKLRCDKCIKLMQLLRFQCEDKIRDTYGHRVVSPTGRSVTVRLKVWRTSLFVHCLLFFVVSVAKYILCVYSFHTLFWCC